MSMNAKTFNNYGPRKHFHGSSFMKCDIERNDCQLAEDTFIQAAADRDRSDG